MGDLIKAGTRVKIKNTEKTSPHEIANGPGYVESIKEDGTLRIIFTGMGGPAGPYDLDLYDVEIIEGE